mmetsp:Transcript_11743/g.45798  ORF Transcript_11743/g.45798 Transcript_11743/m.45798 type:complete len:218 (+) Transcript_11743:443-1096(+)
MSTPSRPCARPGRRLASCTRFPRSTTPLATPCPPLGARSSWRSPRSTASWCLPTRSTSSWASPTPPSRPRRSARTTSRRRAASSRWAPSPRSSLPRFAWAGTRPTPPSSPAWPRAASWIPRAASTRSFPASCRLRWTTGCRRSTSRPSRRSSGPARRSSRRSWRSSSLRGAPSPPSGEDTLSGSSSRRGWRAPRSWRTLPTATRFGSCPAPSSAGRS